MGYRTFSEDDYRTARRDYGVTSDTGVTRKAEQRAQDTGHLSEIVDPAIEPIRRSMIRLDPHQKQWIVTIGCPMDIEVSCDTTGSMGGEVDTEMAVLPDLYKAVSKVLPGYDPQLCLGIFGDVSDSFVMCRPQFEMEAPKIVKYLKEMAPQRDGGDSPEDPQYAMFARAYLTDAYTNKIGLKGYHFIVTDATCHKQITREEIKRIFGENVFNNELENMSRIPTVEGVIEELKKKTHQFILVVKGYESTTDFWSQLCGEKSVIELKSTRQLPEVISAIIGLTEGTLDIGDLNNHLSSRDLNLVRRLSKIDIGAQARLRHALPYPVPKKDDVFVKKGDLWPISAKKSNTEVVPEVEESAEDEIRYL